MTDVLGYDFKDPDLLRRALTHRSAGSPHNERFEFLGDSLLNLIVAEALFQRWKSVDEGALTRARAQLVRGSMLAQIAREFDLGRHLVLGPGEMKSGGHRRDSILADALEAIIAAIHLDGGFAACREVVLGWFGSRLDELPVAKLGKDAKTRLQEWLQGRGYRRPVYTLTATTGEDHNRSFEVTCAVSEFNVMAEGAGSSRRAAEQQAAKRALAQIEASRNDG